MRAASSALNNLLLSDWQMVSTPLLQVDSTNSLTSIAESEPRDTSNFWRQVQLVADGGQGGREVVVGCVAQQIDQCYDPTQQQYAAQPRQTVHSAVVKVKVVNVHRTTLDCSCFWIACACRVRCNSLCSCLCSSVLQNRGKREDLCEQHP
jgi:hypothetical protein